MRNLRASILLILLETLLNLIFVTMEGEKLTTLGRGEVETFIGTKGHVTDWHTDFQVRKL